MEIKVAGGGDACCLGNGGKLRSLRDVYESYDGEGDAGGIDWRRVCK